MTGSDLESLGGAASADLEEMSAALRDDGVTVAVLTGGASGWQNGIPADRAIEIVRHYKFAPEVLLAG